MSVPESTPRRLLVDPSHPDENIIGEAAAVLRNGDLVIVPTETVYGLAADPTVPDAVEKIYRAKKRPESKAIPRLADHIQRIRETGAQLNDLALRLAAAFWPGPLTLVLPVGEISVAFRIPDHPVPLALIAAVGHVLAVTSANLSGESPARTAEEAARAFTREDVALCLDSGPVRGGIPSTVVRVLENELELIREGAIPFRRLKETAKIS